ncbi:TetR/AcrR family transcriptional regulator [Actinoallomurus sp. CA-150999]|uniref:TetR/AcrR family transcriptional regulator n=1 Tax=Actinoallomurus sp. CA-150999 TaxID=3239887 RepID=UPI003D8D97DE
MPRTARLTRDDWAAAALDALTQGGPNAVAVEPVAARLGASKSSFYWLFENRQALLEAALERWERTQTEAVAARLTEIPDPAERLRRLVHQAFAGPDDGDLALRLLTASDDPAVRSVAERVTRRRLAVIETAFAELGHPPELARHYATMSYSAYLGAAALRRVGAAPDDPHAYVDAVLAPFGVPPGA